MLDSQFDVLPNFVRGLHDGEQLRAASAIVSRSASKALQSSQLCR